MSASKIPDRRHAPLAQFTGEYVPTFEEQVEAERRSQELDAKLRAKALAIHASIEAANRSRRALSPEDEAIIRRKAKTQVAVKSNLRPPGSRRPESTGLELFERAQVAAMEAALVRVLEIQDRLRQSGKKSDGRPRKYKRDHWPQLLRDIRKAHPKMRKSDVARKILKAERLPRIAFSVISKFVQRNWDKP